MHYPSWDGSRIFFDGPTFLEGCISDNCWKEQLNTYYLPFSPKSGRYSPPVLLIGILWIRGRSEKMLPWFARRSLAISSEVFRRASCRRAHACTVDGTEILGLFIESHVLSAGISCTLSMIGRLMNVVRKKAWCENWVRLTSRTWQSKSTLWRTTIRIFQPPVQPQYAQKNSRTEEVKRTHDGWGALVGTNLDWQMTNAYDSRLGSWSIFNKQC